MAQNAEQEDCEVIEIDAEQQDAGTVVDFHKAAGPDRHTIMRPFDDVTRILKGADWVPVGSGRDEAGNRVSRMRRRRKTGRAVDDALEQLQS